MAKSFSDRFQLSPITLVQSDPWTTSVFVDEGDPGFLEYLHHRSLHDRGNENEWWKQNKIDPIKEAERLWLKTRNFSQTA